MPTEHEPIERCWPCSGDPPSRGPRRVGRPQSTPGLEIRVIDDGQILLGAAPSIPSTMFNRGLGFAEAPNRIGVAVAFFAGHHVAGEIVLDPADVPSGVEPRLRLEVYLAIPGESLPRSPPPCRFGVIANDETTPRWSRRRAYAPAPEVAALWRSMAAHLGRTADWPSSRAADSRLVAAASIFWRLAWLAELGLGLPRHAVSVPARDDPARARSAPDARCTSSRLALAGTTRPQPRARRPAPSATRLRCAADLG